jgi:addiction module RelE/StbE family toxin
MQYILSKRFEKDFAKLPKQIKIKALATLALFTEDPDHPSLRTHTLKGKWSGHFSIDITGDTRAIYFVIEDGLVRFITVGSHSQLYG